MPVSYTHLDVYKRQALRWVRDAGYAIAVFTHEPAEPLRAQLAEHQRLEAEAKRLLLYTSKNAKEIADILGFEDLSAFSQIIIIPDVYTSVLCAY